MKTHIVVPYRVDKNLGKAYNEVMMLIPDEDRACFIDYDVQLLTPDAGKIIQEYAERTSWDCLLTCFTNRVSPLSKPQLLWEELSESSDIKFHIGRAQKQRTLLYQTSAIERDISGFLMVISKKLWLEHAFNEDGLCLGVDTEYNRRIRAAGKKILRMDGLYVFHAYRLTNGIYYKNHLK